MGEHDRGGECVLGAGAVFGGADDFGDAGPELAGCPEFCDLGELFVGGGEPEGDLIECLFDGESGVGEGAEVFDSGGEGEADFFCISSTLIGEGDGVDQDGAGVVALGGLFG